MEHITKQDASMRKATILGIVPNEAIRSNLLHCAEAYNDIQVHVVVSNFYEAVTLVEQEGSKYDVAIARGQTAHMISNVSDIPLVEIPISIFDILYAEQLAKNFDMPYAILGFQNLTEHARQLKDLMSSPVEIYTLNTFEEADVTMQQILKKGYRLIVTGMGTEHIARRNGLNTIQVNTSVQTLDSTLMQARALALNIAKAKNHNKTLESILKANDTDFICFNRADQSIAMEQFSTMNRQRALNIATKELQLSAMGNADLIKAIDQQTWSVTRREFSTDDRAFTAFFFQKRGQISAAYRNEIATYSKDTAIDIFLSHFPETSMTLQTSSDMLNELASSQLPVLLIGERGTGKNQIAASIYTRCKFQNHPYYRIDFKLCGERTWNYLFTNINSPILSNGNTIFLQNIEQLSLLKLEKLITFLRDSSVTARNKMIFSFGLNPGNRIPPPVQRLLNELVCLDLTIKPLRQRQTELPTLVNLYIATANLAHGKHVVGMTENAERLIVRYPWPDNLMQFNRIMNKLVALANSSYIQESDVADVLAAENANMKDAQALSSVLDIDKPLHEIELEIIKTTLAKTNGNRSLAASKLKISRTTLWRFLQEMEMPRNNKEKI